MFEKDSKSRIQRPHHKRGNLALGQLQKTVRYYNRTQIPYGWSYTMLTRSSSGESGNILGPADGRRKTGRPKKTWRRTFQQDLQMVDFKWEEVEYVATDRLK